MRRFLTVTLAAAAVAVSGLAAAPGASAGTCNDGATTCADPTPVSASGKNVTISTSAGSKSVQLTAVFNDTAGTMRGVNFVVTIPGGTVRTSYAYTPTSVSGTTKTFKATFNAYNFYNPGTYRLRAEAQEASGVDFSAIPAASSTFKVKDQTRMSLYASNSAPKPGTKVKFYGSFYPNNSAAKGSKLKLSFKAKGAKKFAKLGKTKVTKSAKYKFKKVRVNKPGSYRVTFGGAKYLVKSKVTAKYRVYRY